MLYVCQRFNTFDGGVNFFGRGFVCFFDKSMNKNNFILVKTVKKSNILTTLDAEFVEIFLNLLSIRHTEFVFVFF